MKLQVSDERVAKEIAVEAAKAMWRYTIPTSFCKTAYDENSKSWRVEIEYFEKKLRFKIDAATGNVSTIRNE